MVWIIPTMSRPEQCNDVLQSIGPVSKGVVFLNGKSHYREYMAELRFPDGWFMIISDDNLGCIGALNKCMQFLPDEPWYGFVADDEFLVGGNPDDIVAAAGNWNIAHGFDNWNQGKRFHGYCVIGGDLARKVGFLGIPETLHHFGFDCAWEWMSAMPVFGGGGICRNILVDSVRVEHRHHKLGLSIKDECYQAADSSFDSDQRVFLDWHKHRMLRA